jgi:hypothetical protein
MDRVFFENLVEMVSLVKSLLGNAAVADELGVIASLRRLLRRVITCREW